MVLVTAVRQQMPFAASSSSEQRVGDVRERRLGDRADRLDVLGDPRRDRLHHPAPFVRSSAGGTSGRPRVGSRSASPSSRNRATRRDTVVGGRPSASASSVGVRSGKKSTTPSTPYCSPVMPVPAQTACISSRTRDGVRNAGRARSRVPAGGRRGSRVGHGSDTARWNYCGSTLPGFMIPFGSKSALTARISGSRSPCSRSR